jgi:peptidyl-prolyl cis-trans isomerase D
MAMIEKIRNQRWLLIVVVGVSLLGFLVNGAVLKWIQGGDPDVGEIAGESINIAEWTAATNEQKVLFNYSGNETSLSNDTWNNLVERKLLSEQFEKAGITVTEEEYDEVLFGEMLSPYVKQTIYGGQDSASFREQMRTNFDGMEPERAAGWKNLIMHKRMKEKYDLMLKRGMYANNLDGKWAFKQQSDKINLSYVVKSYAEIPDSTVEVSESDIRSYYNKHKNDREYKQEVSRSVNYIRFPVRPSSNDSLSLRESLTSLAESFRVDKNDSAFAATNATPGSKPMISYTANKFPEPYNTQVLNDSIGKVIGPFEYNGKYAIAKVSKRMNVLDSVKARHILIKADRKDAAALATARAKADSIKNVIAKEKNFEAMAAQFGSDGTKTSGGDLGWFGKGAMVKEFEDASFSKPKGELSLVTTDFGVHVLEVTDQKFAVAKVAMIEKTIEPSASTRKGAYALASEFSINFADSTSFRAAADTLNGGTPIMPAKNIRPNSTTINGLQNGYPVVSWAFGAELGEVSQPMMIDNDYIIATLVDVKERGVPTLANVYDKMKQEAIKEKKAEKFMELMKSGSLEEIAKAVESTVKTADNVTLKSGNIPGSGVSAQEYEVIGIAFGLKKDFISSPIKGKGGVYVLQKTSDIVEGTSTDNYTADRDQMMTNLQNRAASSIFNSFKEEAEVIDDRFTRR